MLREGMYHRSLLVLGMMCLLMAAAPDGGALKIQGPDTLGTPVPVTLVGPGSGSVTQTAVTASASAGNTSNTATLAGVAAKTTYLTGFECTASGSTAGLPVTVTVTGTISGTLNYTFSFVAGVLVESTPLIVEFTYPIPSSAVNTAIVVTFPAGGAGNTNATVTAHGFYQ
jgi:hypothetical protein